jgi:hypothetical protein
MDRCHKRADSAIKYTLYFELLVQKFKQYKVDPRQVYNMDEKCFLIRVLSKMKRIFNKKKYKDGMHTLIQDGNREWITTIAYICADGTSLLPALIYEATTGNIQDTWLEGFKASKDKCFFSSLPSGWTNADLGYQ